MGYINYGQTNETCCRHPVPRSLYRYLYLDLYDSDLREQQSGRACVQPSPQKAQPTTDQIKLLIKIMKV